MPADRHVEHHLIPGRRLGRRPADPARPVLKLRDYLTGVLPDHPPQVDYFSKIPSWILGANDQFGTCGPTSLANLILLVSSWLGDTPVRLGDTDIFDLYRRSGNPNFDPATGADDNGVDMTVMLSAAVQGGIGDHEVLAFAQVNGNDPTEVWAAGALFGGVLWGADLSTAQQTQTDTGLWDYDASAGQWGGHAIAAAGRYDDQPGTTADRTGLVSWAQVLDSTDTFMAQQVPERYVVVLPEHLGSKAFQQGVNLSALASDYEALTGRPFPVVPAPTPGPTPTPVPPGPTPVPPGPVVDDIDRALWAAVQPALTHLPHHWAVAKVHRALDKWHTDKGGF